MQNDTILDVFPGTSENHRLVLVQSETMCGLKHLVLRQETHSPNVGWFVQSCVAIQENQIAALKMALSPARFNAGRGQATVQRAAGHSSRNTASTILKFDEAANSQVG